MSKLDFFDEASSRAGSGEKYVNMRNFDDSQAPDLFDEKFEKKEEPKNEKISEAVQEAPVEEVAPEAQEAGPEAEAAAQIAEEIKQLSAFMGEQEFKMPASAKFKQKVDGSEVEVELQELLNNYSGKQAWDRKFTDLDKERKSYQSDLELVNKYIGEFARQSKENPVKALEFLAEQIGLDPFEYKKHLRTQMVDQFSPYMQMDQQERELYLQREELEYLRRRQQSQMEMHQRQQAAKELEAKYQALEQHGIDSNRRSEIVSQLQDAGYQNISPDLVLQAHQAFVNQDRAFAALEKISPNLTGDEGKVRMLESLLSGNSSISDDDLFSYASKLWGDAISEGAADLQKTIPKPKDRQPAQTYKPKKASPGYVDFFND